MALTRADHKRIALSVAEGLKKALSQHNGERLLAKHKARMGKPPVEAEPDADDSDLESALAGPPGTMDEDEPEMPPPVGHKGQIPRHGMGMKGKGGAGPRRG